MENPTFTARTWRTWPSPGRRTSEIVGAFISPIAVAAAFVVPSAAVPTKKGMVTPTHLHSLRARTT